MKKKIFVLLLLVFSLVGCNKSSFEEIKIDNVNHQEPLGEFGLLTPAYGTIVEKDIPTFTWEESANADYYILEVCNQPTFSNEETTYLRKTGIGSTSYTLDDYLRTKETTYYWRVTSANSSHQLLCSNEYSAFYLTSVDYGEIKFSTDYADEWSVHNQGSPCDISIDKTDFFGNGVNSLAMSFTREYTNTGNPESDGWMVISKQVETELYGVDAFYFNFYYNGQDSNIFFRVIDEDNEYYHAQIKIAANAKQTIIIKFEDFVLRTKGGTPIINQVFDYNYIKAIELVYEQTFGDGVCMISDIRAIHYNDYQHLFISTFDFNELDQDSFILDHYDNFTVDISEDGSSFTYSYGSDMNGYGFVKTPINRMVVNGDSFKVKLSHTGSSTHRILFRLIEEDGDRWVYRQNCDTLIEDYLIIPFKAFMLSEANGDGARQFYFLKQLQFGLENAYGQGSITFTDLSICYLEEEITDLYQNYLGDDGLIENFEEYDTSVKMYYRWQNSVDNKDESLSIDSQYTPKGIGQSGKFTYKTDMYPASYGLQFNNTISGFNGLSLSALDKSILKNPSSSQIHPFDHLGNGEPKMIITLYVSDGSEYFYVINQVQQSWTKYNILFSDFILNSGFSIFNAEPLEMENIVGLRLDIQFYYYDKNYNPSPQYVSSNPVYLDDLYFVNISETSQSDVLDKIKPHADNANLITIDDFENENLWQMSGLDYESLAIEHDEYLDSNVLRLGYKGNTPSVSYGRTLNMDESCVARGLIIDIKGDDKATVYINIYVDYAGSTYKYRATLKNVSSEWTTYNIGFSNFEKIEGTGDVALSRNLVNKITKITFGIVNSSDYALSSIEIDNIMLDNVMSYSQNGSSVIVRG